LAKLLGWRFDKELGDILRDKDNLKDSGHLCGDGTSTDADADNNGIDAWDDLIHSEEMKRDKGSEGICRIVETWHVGNLKWYQLRRLEEKDDKMNNANELRYSKAIEEHQQTSFVLRVHLNLASSKVVMSRRNQYSSNRERLPLKREAIECEEMFQLFGYDNASESVEMPVLVVDNGLDGDDAIASTLKEIMRFIHKHYYKCVKT
jgi:hypothetical protein